MKTTLETNLYTKQEIIHNTAARFIAQLNNTDAGNHRPLNAPAILKTINTPQIYKNST